jgi:23S rRNA pseudouridine1911/1915/1917 synthase
LDQPVEGLMVFAKNQKAAAGLSKQIQQHMIGKHYYAMSASIPVEKEGVLENYLVTDKKSNYTSVVDVRQGKTLPDDAKKAVLEYKVIAQKEGLTLFDILLHTGRQHQIRVQMAHMGCPLVGDEKYGMIERQGGQDIKVVIRGKTSLALCSYRLEFVHPTTGKKMDFSIQPEWEMFS